jgi:hypothetical protein
MKCKQCDTPLPDEARYCIQCGVRQDRPADEPFDKTTETEVHTVKVTAEVKTSKASEQSEEKSVTTEKTVTTIGTTADNTAKPTPQQQISETGYGSSEAFAYFNEEEDGYPSDYIEEEYGAQYKKQAKEAADVRAEEINEFVDQLEAGAEQVSAGTDTASAAGGVVDQATRYMWEPPTANRADAPPLPELNIIRGASRLIPGLLTFLGVSVLVLGLVGVFMIVRTFFIMPDADTVATHFTDAYVTGNYEALKSYSLDTAMNLEYIADSRSVYEGITYHVAIEQTSDIRNIASYVNTHPWLDLLEQDISEMQNITLSIDMEGQDPLAIVLTLAKIKEEWKVVDLVEG